MSQVVDLDAHRPWVPADTFGARLALVRQRMGWNMTEAATACGLNPSSWIKWEKNSLTPRGMDRVARAISETSGCDYVWLLAGAEALTSRGPDRGPDSPGGLGFKQSTWNADIACRVIQFPSQRGDLVELPIAV